jgi:Fe-S cluster biogenesis protein NfuA
MALLETFLNTIGLVRPIRQKPLEQVFFGDAALVRLSKMPTDWALHVETHPTELGRLLVAEEGPAQGPPPPGFEQALVISDSDLNWLSGLILDVDDAGWHLHLKLRLSCQETPNPNGRLYVTDRMLAHGSPQFFAKPEQAPPFARQLLGINGVSAVLFRENTVTIEREENEPWNVLDPKIEIGLKSYFLACGQALTSEDTANFRTPLENEILEVLKKTILPNIHRDGGDLHLIGVKDGVVQVSLVGACRSCPASTLTLKAGIEKTLKQHFPHTIHRVEAVEDRVSSTTTHQAG